MLNISKYHKLILGCSAIATAVITGFVPSAEAAGQLINQAAQSTSGTTLIADGNGSNGTGSNVSNSTGGNTSNSTGSNGTGSTGTGNLRSSNSSNPRNGGSGPSSTDIARSQALSSRIGIAAGKYDVALAALAAAEAAQTNASSNREPVRFARQVADASACGCPNTDTASAGTPSKELIAAKAAEAEAAAELAAAKAEALQFLESVKDNSGANNSASFQPIW